MELSKIDSAEAERVPKVSVEPEAEEEEEEEEPEPCSEADLLAACGQEEVMTFAKFYSQKIHKGSKKVSSRGGIEVFFTVMFVYRVISFSSPILRFVVNVLEINEAETLAWRSYIRSNTGFFRLKPRYKGFTSVVLLPQVGEGTFGEVYLLHFPGSEAPPPVLKVVRVGEGATDSEASEPPTTAFGDILSEVLVSRELSALSERGLAPNFMRVDSAVLVKGRYPKGKKMFKTSMKKCKLIS